MPELDDMLADILSYSPTEKGEIRPFRPMIRPGENGLNSTFSPLSPLSPAIPLKLNSPNSPNGHEIECLTDEPRLDDRVKCSDCTHIYGGYCQQFKATNHGVKYKPERSTPKRCGLFKLKIRSV